MDLKKGGNRRYRHAGDLTDEPPTRKVSTFVKHFRKFDY